MSLIVETGAGLPDADSYLGLAEADAYHSARAHDDWAGDTTAKEAALRQAAAVLDGRYRARWPGRKASYLQALDWPRVGAIDRAGYFMPSHTVPLPVRQAAAELALRALKAPLAPDLARGGQIRSESVAGLSVTYADAAPPGTSYPLVDLILGALLRAEGVRPIDRG